MASFTKVFLFEQILWCHSRVCYKQKFQKIAFTWFTITSFFPC